MSQYQFDCIISGLQLLPQRMEVMDFMIPTVYSGYMVGGGVLWYGEVWGNMMRIMIPTLFYLRVPDGWRVLTLGFRDMWDLSGVGGN